MLKTFNNKPPKSLSINVKSTLILILYIVRKGVSAPLLRVSKAHSPPYPTSPLFIGSARSMLFITTSGDSINLLAPILRIRKICPYAIMRMYEIAFHGVAF